MPSSLLRSLFTAFVCIVPMSAFALDASAIDSIRIYDYSFLELQSPNATSVLVHAAATISFCRGITGSKSDLDEKLMQLAAPLVDKKPDITNKLRSIGAAGFFGDSTGLVPLASIAEIVRIKKISEKSFCTMYEEYMMGNYQRYLTRCHVSADHESYVCPSD